jgi:hypothetical protein
MMPPPPPAPAPISPCAAAPSPCTAVDIRCGLVPFSAAGQQPLHSAPKLPSPMWSQDGAGPALTSPAAVAGSGLPNVGSTTPTASRCRAALRHSRGGLGRTVAALLGSRASPAPPSGALVSSVVIGSGNPAAGSTSPTSCPARLVSFQARYATDFPFVVLNGMVCATTGPLLLLRRRSRPQVFVTQVSIHLSMAAAPDRSLSSPSRGSLPAVALVIASSDTPLVTAGFVLSRGLFEPLVAVAACPLHRSVSLAHPARSPPRSLVSSMPLLRQINPPSL